MTTETKIIGFGPATDTQLDGTVQLNVVGTRLQKSHENLWSITERSSQIADRKRILAYPVHPTLTERLEIASRGLVAP
jgi:hypothetical protein